MIVQDVRRDALVLVDLWSDPRRLWRLPNAGERRWTAIEIAGPQYRPAYSVNSWAYDPANDRLLVVGVVYELPESCCTDTSGYRSLPRSPGSDDG
jgi:hypothetical protein